MPSVAPPLSAALIQRVYRCPAQRAMAWQAHLQAAALLADISTPQRMACWLAQLGHESGRLRYTREIWGPTRAQLRYERDFAHPWPPADQQRKRDHHNSLAYTLGNCRPGDGSRYKGRGPIQTTGRSNYLRVTARLRALLGNDVPDFITAPALLELPHWGALSTAMFWRDRGLNTHADSGDFAALTKHINGGLNGLADRQALYTAAIGALI